MPHSEREMTMTDEQKLKLFLEELKRDILVKEDLIAKTYAQIDTLRNIRDRFEKLKEELEGGK